MLMIQLKLTPDCRANHQWAEPCPHMGLDLPRDFLVNVSLSTLLHSGLFQTSAWAKLPGHMLFDVGPASDVSNQN